MAPYSIMASSLGERETNIGFPSVKNGGSDLSVVVWSMESAEGGRDEDRALSLSGVMTMSEEKSVLMAMIPCIDNGGCMKEGSIGDQRQAVVLFDVSIEEQSMSKRVLLLL